MQKVTQFSLRCQAAAYALLATSGIHPVYGLAFPPLNFSQSHKDKKILSVGPNDTCLLAIEQ